MTLCTHHEVGTLRGTMPEVLERKEATKPDRKASVTMTHSARSNKLSEVSTISRVMDSQSALKHPMADDNVRTVAVVLRPEEEGTQAVPCKIQPDVAQNAAGEKGVTKVNQAKREQETGAGRKRQRHSLHFKGIIGYTLAERARVGSMGPQGHQARCPAASASQVATTASARPAHLAFHSA